MREDGLSAGSVGLIGRDRDRLLLAISAGTQRNPIRRDGARLLSSGTT
jgi:hypothetical protein